MKKFINNHGLLAFSIDAVDYVTNKGDTLELPENNEYVKRLLITGMIVENAESVKPSKTQNNGISPRS